MILSAKFTPGTTSTTFTLTFDTAFTSIADLYQYEFSTSSLGVLEFSSAALDVTMKIVTAVTPAVIPVTDYVRIEGTYTTPPVLIGGSGNNVIIGDGQVEVIFANEGADFIDSGWGEDQIYLSETTKAIDTVKITDEGAGFQDMIFGFDVSVAATNDKLNMWSNNIAAAAAIADGVDVGTIAKHTIGAGGIVSFQTSTGAAILIDTELEAANALSYLDTNLTVAGTTVAFRYDSDTDGVNDGMMVYQKQAIFEGSGAVSLEGIGSTAILGKTAAIGTVTIQDTTGPDILNATTTTNGVKLYFNEKLTSASLSGVSMLKNGVTDMGAGTAAYDATMTIVTKTTATALLATDYVEFKWDPSIATYAIDLSGNKGMIQPEEGGIIIGGEGNNTINQSAKTQSYNIMGQGGNDTITGTSYDDSLQGGIGDDILNGGGGYDELMGGAGNDTLNGGLGSDSMDGGMGNDTYIVSGYDNVWEDYGAGTDLVKSYESYYDLRSNFENLQLMRIGASGYGNELNNTIYAGKGGNNINGGYGGSDTASYQYAAAGVNANLSTSSATVSGQNQDTLSNIDNLTGSNYADILTGDTNANILNGGLLGDTMAGGAGNDAYYRDNTGDVLTEGTGAGLDTVVSTLAYTLLANFENLTLSGTTAINGTGNTVANTLTGNTAANTLTGLAGNDILIGGLGNDTLSGGLNQDIFRFNTAPNITTNKDTITDFVAADDTIQLENAIFTKLTTVGTLAAANLSLTGAPVDTNDFIIYSSTTGILSYDADGSGTASSAIQIALIGTTTHPTLTAADFVVI